MLAHRLERLALVLPNGCVGAGLDIAFGDSIGPRRFWGIEDDAIIDFAVFVIVDFVGTQIIRHGL